MLIQNLSIRNKLLLISMLPLIALLYFLLLNITGEIESKKKVQQVYEEVVQAEAVSSVLHELQQERGYSVGFMLSSGKDEEGELNRQRIRTDEAVSQLGEIFEASGKPLYGFLDSLPFLRSAINSSRSNSDSIRKVFAEINLAFIAEINKTALSSRNPEVKNILYAHMFLLHGKEFFGQLRANLKQSLLTKNDHNTFADFAGLKSRYELSLENFRSNSPKEVTLFYDKKMQAPFIRSVNEMIRIAYAGGNLTESGFTEQDWWINGLSFLNILKEIEDYSSSSIRKTALNQTARLTNSVYRSIALASAIILLLIILLFYTIRSVVSSVTKIKEAADRITKGDLNISLSLSAKDELGDLADSFARLIEVSKEYSDAADSIGRGDYSPVVRVRSSSDILGVSLNNMKENLQKLSRENEARTWLLSSSSEINDVMRGEKHVRELAREVVNKLAEKLRARVGAIYIFENGQYSLAGSYAYTARKGNKNRFEVGQGLVGQAALEKKPIFFTEVPENYLTINSALGNLAPKNIVVYPFMHEGHVNGIIELGSASDFTELDLQLLELVSENIGISFNSAQSREQLKELLEETQRQGEELETQQEELRQINQELEQKTEMLEKSELELKAQQEELQQSNLELEEKANMLEEQKNKLETAKMEVEGKARELEVTGKYKSEFLANMSHELRTPLNSILILAQILSENKSKSLAEKDIQLAKNIYSSGVDLLELINEILDLSKVEAGKIELDIAEIKLEEVATNMDAMFREIAKDKNIEFEVSIPDKIHKTPFSGDRQRLEQILKNLLSNAFKFTAKGGKVRLNINLAKGTDNVLNRKLAEMQDLLTFSVSDNGIGIPEGKQNIVFEAFQQADGSTKRKYGGTGLGLSISRELAQAMGGELVLESEEGKGSIFTLYIPASYDASIAVPATKEVTIKERKVSRNELAEVPEAPGVDVFDDRFTIQENDKIILIVEDDLEFARILLNFVHDKGYKGVVAHQGNAALSLARCYRPDAIMLDMKLPVMDGTEVLKHLKQDPNLRHIPVQVISGYDKRKEGIEFGAFDFIKKPISQQDLDNALTRMEDFINRKLKKLLVVEDNLQQNNAIRELIGNGDVHSSSAYTGEDAYSLMQKEAFDCVIVDLGLPDMSGFDLLERIKNDNMVKKVPIIVYTGKELSRDETLKLNKLSNAVVLKTADSKERLLDETTLFLHRVESRLPKEKQEIIRKLHRTDEVLNNKKVLIVDDDMRNIYSLTNALEEEGIKCITAENGMSALETLNNHPDTEIILMDIMMPEMDGYEATRAIRKMSRFKKLPIIALTAKAMKGDREKCLEAGMSDYISKPVNIEQLLSLMRVWLYT